MKCKVVQQRLLAITYPERVPVGLRNHLARCAACREWHNHLILLERHVSVLPLPRSTGKAKLLRYLLQEEAPRAQPASSFSETDFETPPFSHARALPRLPERVPARAFPSSRAPLRRRNLLLGAAAALLLTALGWLALHG